MIVVSDSSPLIALSAVARLDLLAKLFQRVIIPTAVHDEVFCSNKIACSLHDFIIVKSVTSETPSRFLKMNLHIGESEAIALALEQGVERIILDDKQARKTATQLGLTVIGTLGLLLLAKKKGLLLEIRPVIIALIEKIHFRIAPTVINRALHEIGESPL